MGAETVLNVTGLYCVDCGEGVLSGENLKAVELGYAEFKARVDGVLSPSDIFRIRKRLALSQDNAGSLVGGGKMMFSKYENGRAAPSMAMSNLLRLLDRHPNLLTELQGFAASPATRAGKRGEQEQRQGDNNGSVLNKHKKTSRSRRV